METNHDTKYTLTLPATFFADHAHRGCVSSSGHAYEYTVKETKSKVTVTLSEADALDVISDADYYSTEWKYMGPEYFGLGRSAVATRKAAAQQMYEQGYRFTVKQARDWSLRLVLPDVEFITPEVK